MVGGGVVRKKFIDRVLVYARGGSGGQGSLKLGGIGGEGGNVEVVCREGASLSQLARQASRRYIAGPGEGSSKRCVHGKKGNNVTIKVPPGTVVMHPDTKKQVYDLASHGTRQVLAKGGEGGSHMTPSGCGQHGSKAVYLLVLKSIADIGLVGFPNAGKSTLLKVLTKASPRIADYPFTTVQPQLGTLFQEDGRGLVLADLPGLVEGAHENVGMGHKFLRHIERTRGLLYVVDVNGFQLSPRHAPRDAHASLRLLVEELELYCPGLALQRPAILALNKMDSPQAEEKATEFLQQLVTHCPINLSCVVKCSARETSGLLKLKQVLLDLL